MQNHTIATKRQATPSIYPTFPDRWSVCFETKKNVEHTVVIKSAGISVIQ